MIKREYGKTGKMVSVIGFGGMRFPEEDYTNNQDKCADLVKYAFEKGINYFDTAPSYCNWQSEICMGKAFVDMKRDDFVVSSKVMTEEDRNAVNTYECIEKSLEKMKLAKLDICHAWCLKTYEDYERVMKKGGVYEGLMRAKQDGLVDVVSFSTHMTGADIARVAKESPNDFEGVLLGYNALNYSYREEGIDAFAKLNKGIVIMNPLGGGLIPKNTEKFARIAQNGDGTVLGAIKFLSSQKRITTVLTGISSKKEVDMNVLGAENLYDEDGIMQSIKNGDVNTGFNDLCTLCSYCNHCPVGISPHKLMFSYNEKVMGGNDGMVLDQIKYNYDIDAKEANKCIGCGKCEKLCTQKLPIIQRIKDIQKMILD